MSSWFPAKSQVLPTEVDTRTRLSRNIQLNIPIVSAAMDTVTEALPGHCHGTGRQHRHRAPGVVSDGSGS